MAQSKEYPTLLRIVGAVLVAVGEPYAAVLGAALNVAANDRERRFYNREADKAFEASLKDRQIVVRGADVPGDIAYGRVGKIGGVLVYAESAGALKEEMHVVVALSPIHEIDAIEKIFIGDVEVGTLDGNGWVQDGHFAKSTPTPLTFQFTANGSANQAVTVPNAPSGGFPVTCFTQGAPTTDNPTNQELTVVSVVGNVVTVNASGLAGRECLISYTSAISQSLLRIRKYLGTPNDQADAVLVAASGGRWTAQHRGRGRPHIVATCIYDQDVWASIDPTQITAVIRGKKVFDPRTSTTAWSRNAILQQRDYLVDTLGFKIPSAQVPNADVYAGANIADETITVDTSTLGADQPDWERMLSDAVPHGLWTRQSGSGGFTFEDRYSGALGAYTTVGTGATGVIQNGEFVLHNSAGQVAVSRWDSVASHAGATIEVDMYVPLIVDAAGNSSVIFCSTYWGAPTAQSYGYEIQLRQTVLLLAKGSNSPLVPFANVITSTAHGIAAGTRVRVKIIYQDVTSPTPGKRIRGFVNGVQLIDYTDTSSPWTTGQVGYRGFASSAQDWRFDNVRIDGFVTAGVYTQPRYAGDGVLSTAANRLENLQTLLSASAGFTTFSQGLCRIFAGAYRTPLSPALTDADLTAEEPIETQSMASIRDLFNAVRGTHFSPVANYQRTDFPLVANSTYETEDGERLEIDLPLPMTADAIAAQRLAKIALEEGRQALVQSAAFNLAAYLRTPGDTVQRTSTRYGWSGKAFRVLDRKFTSNGVVGLVVKEESPFSWDWTPGQATTTDPAPNTLLPSPSVATPISGLALTSAGQYVVSADGTVTSRILATWTAPADANITNGGAIEVEYRRADLTTWVVVDASLPGSATSVFISPVSEGASYFVRVRTRNPLGVRSAWVVSTPHQVATKGAGSVTVAPAGLTLTLVGATTRRFAWSMASYPATLQNFEIRYQAGVSIAWATATKLATIAADRSSSLTWVWETDLPGAGTFSFEIRSVDSLGNYSGTGSQLLNQTVPVSGIPADGTVTVPKLGTPFESLCPDPYFADVTWWTSGLGLSPFEVQDSNGSSNQPALLGVRRAAVLASPTYAGSGSVNFASDFLQFSAAGQKLRLRARASNTSNSTLLLQVLFYDIFKSTVLGTPGITWPAGGGISSKSTIITVPNGTAWMRFNVLRSDAFPFSGTVSISEVKLDVAADTDLIPPGAVVETVEQVVTEGINAGVHQGVVDETTFWSGTAVAQITVTPTLDCEAEAIATGNIIRTNTSSNVIDEISGTLIKLSTEAFVSPIPREWQNMVQFARIPANNQLEAGFQQTRRVLLSAGVSYTFQLYLRRVSATTALGTARLYGGRFRVRLYKR